MTPSSGVGRSTQVSQIVRASREEVYQAFLDPEALASWLAPENMQGQVHILEPHVGGTIRMSLTYLNPEDSSTGKSSEDTDTFEGKFVELIPNEKIVWVTVFESPQPEFAGEMRIIWSLADADGETEVTVRCDDIPPGIRLEDNELGSQSSLRKLAAFIERGGSDSPIALDHQ